MCATSPPTANPPPFTRKIVLANLKANLKWVEKQSGSRRTPTSIDRAGNIMVGCVQLLKQCAVPVGRWLDRTKGRRQALRNIRERYTKQDGNRALRQLLKLTIVSLEAANWITTLPVGALPTPREPRVLTESERAQRSAALAKRRKRE